MKSVSRPPREDTANRPDGFELPTQYLQHYAFSSFAPVTQMGVRYASGGIFDSLVALAFLSILAGGLVFAYRKSKLWACVVSFALPLVLVMYASDPVQDIFSAALGGGILVTLVLVGQRAWIAIVGWRQARLALAPDPYLEEVSDTPPSPASETDAESETDSDSDSDSDADADADADTDTDTQPQATPPPEKKIKKIKKAKRRSQNSDADSDDVDGDA